MKRRKLLYMAALVAVLALNGLYVNYQFFLMLVMVVAVPLILWLLFVLSRIRLRLFVKVEKNVLTLHQKIRLKIKLENGVPVPVSWGRLSLQLRYSNQTGVEERKVSVQALMASARESRLEILPVHCGIVHIHLDELEVRDYLQLFSVRYDYDLLRQIVVFPERIRVDGTVDNCREQEEEYIFSHLPLDNTEVLDLRTYVVGDPMNRIHWKLSMNSDDYIVRQYGEAVDQRVSIFVDLSRDQKKDFRDCLDLIYQAAYSIGGFYAENGEPSRFVAWDGFENKLVLLEFDDLAGLDQSMAELMCIRCVAQAADLMDMDYEHQMGAAGGLPILITAQAYRSSRYLVIDVKSASLPEILTALSKQAG